MSNILSMLVVLFVFSCNSASFSGGAGTSKQKPDSPNTPTVTPKTPTDGTKDDIPPTVPVPTGTGGTLKIEKIPDQKVNSGEKSSNLSEALHVEVKLTGGEGQIDLSQTNTKNSPNPSFAGAMFYWIPGTGSGASYDNEVGTYTVTITAKDSKGQTASTSFNVTIKPIGWAANHKEVSSDTDMITDFEVDERLHPGRQYAHNGTLNGEALNSKTCISFVQGGNSIELLEAPTVVSGTSSADGETNKHTFTLTFRHPKDQQPTDNTGYVTWLNFEPNPSTTISSETAKAKPVRIYFAFARCKNVSDYEQCKKTTAEGGPQNYYYCSDYFETNDKYSELKGYYCGFASLNGVTGNGCN